LSITDVQIATDGNDCADGYYPLYNSTWGGIAGGFGCQLTDDQEVVYTYADYTAAQANGTAPSGCTEIPYVDPVVQTRTIDTSRTVCGKYGGDPFKNVTLADDTQPEGYSWCSEASFGTIYYPVDQMDSCPILSLFWEEFD
jgi:hypothetical protein